MRTPPFRAVLSIGILGSFFALAGPAVADEWCSLHLKAGSMIDCGYSSYAECQQKTGKDAVCIPDPDHAELTARPHKRAG